MSVKYKIEMFLKKKVHKFFMTLVSAKRTPYDEPCTYRIFKLKLIEFKI